MKITLFGLSALVCMAAFADTPTITGVTAQQRYPWNGKVDISYTITGDVAAEAKQRAVFTSLKVTATDKDTETIYEATQLSGDASLAEGIHSIVWDMDAEGLSVKSTNIVFTVECATTPALYCVIDLSGGSSASSYPVTYLAEPPSGGFNVDTYKTTKLVLRRIEAGSFKMEGEYDVTLTKSFFAGIFEVTQQQYSLIMGSNPSQNKGDKRPVEMVSYDALRGTSSGAMWPSSSAVDQSSFIGKLRTRTGLNFDLPTEAQWEYSCRAGTTSKYNNGGNTEIDLKKLGRYTSNQSDGKGGYSHFETTVGSYQPNAWGLYDMHGNVWEWCLDWNGEMNYGDDPVGQASGTGRCLRGGSWHVQASACTSDGKTSSAPSLEHYHVGIRLFRVLEN